MSFLDQFLFVALPYVCLFTFFLVTIYRYRVQSFSYSSLSSQFIENKHHFWAVVPFHYGILVVTAGHFVAFLIPRAIMAWNGHPLRLYVLEVSALIFGLLTLIGLVGVIVRRCSNTKIRRVTTVTDWVLFAMPCLRYVVLATSRSRNRILAPLNRSPTHTDCTLANCRSTANFVIQVRPRAGMRASRRVMSA
jgi:respiratory nitrate reductase gamma subunit